MASSAGDESRVDICSRSTATTSRSTSSRGTTTSCDGSCCQAPPTPKADIHHTLHDAPTIGSGFSSMVHRLDAVAKAYTHPKFRDREVAVYRRLQPEGEHDKWHPHILRFYGVLDDRSCVLRFARHGSIRDYLGNDDMPTPPLATKLRWALNATEAVAYVHSHGVLHSDISCNNIFLTRSLDVQLGDFAGSTLDDLDCLTIYETGHALPDTREPSAQSEVFALGCVYYEILTGLAPYDDIDDEELEEHYEKGEFPCVQCLPALRGIISRCWEGKYDDVEALLTEVRNEVELKLSLIERGGDKVVVRGPKQDRGKATV